MSRFTKKELISVLVRRIMARAIALNQPITFPELLATIESEVNHRPDRYKTREALIFYVKDALIVQDWQIPKNTDDSIYRSRY